MKELQLEILDIVTKEPKISTLELARRLKIAPDTARKHRNIVMTILYTEVKKKEQESNSLFSTILRAVGIRS